MMSRNLKPYYFYGFIPYAMPPVGDQRFEVKIIYKSFSRVKILKHYFVI